MYVQATRTASRNVHWLYLQGDSSEAMEKDVFKRRLRGAFHWPQPAFYNGYHDMQATNAWTEGVKLDEHMTLAAKQCAVHISGQLFP